MRIPTTAEDCHTLSEYRDFVLRKSQSEVARKAGRKQAWISFVERGHLPHPRAWPPLLKALELETESGERAFVRMVLAAAKLNGLKTRLADKYPLLAQTTGEGVRLDLTAPAKVKAS